MEPIGLVGIDWRMGGPEALASFTLPVEERPQRLPEIARQVGLRELVYVATCNRVEVTFVGANGTPVATYRQRLFEALTGREVTALEAARGFRAWAGEGAVEHLFLLAAGLESAMVGEREIVGQMRAALELSRSLELVGPATEAVFREAWRVGRRVHELTAIGRGKVSLAELALQRTRERLEQSHAPVALVGVSSMTRQCAKALAAEGVRLVLFNRTPGRARELAAETGATLYPLSELRTAEEPVEVVILATAAPRAVVSRADLECLAARADSGRPPLLIDLATPPDVLPEDAEAAGLPRIGMEEILRQAEQHRQRRASRAAEARALVDEALAGHARRVMDQALAPMFAALQRRYRHTALEGVERLLRKQLPGLGDEEQAVVRRWARALARRFAHLPTVGLREIARRHGLDAVGDFFRTSDTMLAAELQELLRGIERPTGAAGMRIGESDRGQS